MKKINLLIAEGRKLFREALTALLRNEVDVRVVGEATDARSAAKMIEPLSARVVLLNVNGVALGADAVRTLVSAGPNVRVVVLALQPSSVELKALLDAGAAACLTKECSAGELLAAIRSAAAGQVYLSPALMRTMVDGYVRPARGVGPARALAAREIEVLRLIASGKATKEIAYDFGVSAKTVETYRRRIMEKLDRHSVAELTQYAVAQGLIALEIPA
ncbi:MAG TPA: response regulator transcription factor [Humisphaera sp.]